MTDRCGSNMPALQQGAQSFDQRGLTASKRRSALTEKKRALTSVAANLLIESADEADRAAALVRTTTGSIVTQWFGDLAPWRRKFAVALACLIASTSAQSGRPSPSLIDSVPARWHQVVATACAVDPETQRKAAEVYFSEYVGFRKLLLLGPSGRYHLMHWNERAAIGRAYAGTFRRSSERISLDIELDARSLGSDGNDAILVPMRIGAQRFLLLEKSLADIGATIQWHGLLGEGDDYFVEAHCEQAPPTFPLDGPPAPPRSELPDALKRVTFAQPVDVHIIALAEDSRSYDYAARDGEFLVRIDKGSKDAFRINMPLCSPRRTRQQWKGWVGDTLADSSEVRIVIHERKPGQPLVFPTVGQVLTTSAAQCDGLDTE